jgi:putative MFS transporter
MLARVFGDRRHAWAFWLGCLAVTVGVVLHLPMYWMARDMGFRMAGMPMDAGMAGGMGLILAGCALAAFGLLPRVEADVEPVVVIAPPEDASLTPAHWMMCALLALALVIDIMKPASLGFVTPGMKAEYGLAPHLVALLPFGALAGTVVGSFVWGWLADVYGRRASILLSSVMFVGTSICGAMPDFWWNVGMCFLMGAAAGGMLPVAYALLAEIMPTRHRGWSLVLVGGVGAVGGYFAASAFSAWLQPAWGWRILWFLNLPTGLILIGLSPFLPESARFLQHIGRGAEARAMLAKFGAVVAIAAPRERESHSHLPPVEPRYLGVTTALTLAALAWGLVNFGVLLWLPGALVQEGASVEAASGLIASSALIAAPTIVLAVWLYSAWSTRGGAGADAAGDRGGPVRPFRAQPGRRGPGRSARAAHPADRRVERGHLYPPALYGGEFSLAHPRPGDRLDGGLQQTRRSLRPGSQRLRPRPAARAGRRPGRRALRGRALSDPALGARDPRPRPARPRKPHPPIGAWPYRLN